VQLKSTGYLPGAAVCGVKETADGATGQELQGL
jgi:hypothetical protein